MLIIDAHMHIWTRVPEWRGYLTPNPSYGMVVIDGQEHDMLPPCFIDSTSPPELAVAFMDRYGVHSGVIAQEAMDGFLNESVAQTVCEYPERFHGVGLPDPRDPDSSARLDEWFKADSLQGIKIPYGSFRKLQPDFDILTPPASEWLRICHEAGRLVIIHPPSPREFLPALRDAAERYHGATFILAHMGLPNKPGWDAILDLCASGNLYMDLSAIPLLMGEDYPCQHSREILKTAIRKIGAKKLLWGTDYPRTLNSMTYGQMINWVVGCEEITNEDKELIMGLNAQRLFGSAPSEDAKRRG